MKQIYQELVIKLFFLSAEDVIRTSFEDEKFEEDFFA